MLTFRAEDDNGNLIEEGVFNPIDHDKQRADKLADIIMAASRFTFSVAKKLAATPDMIVRFKAINPLDPYGDGIVQTGKAPLPESIANFSGALAREFVSGWGGGR